MKTVLSDTDSATAPPPPSPPPPSPPPPAAEPAGVPVADSFAGVTSAVPAELTPAQLPDLIVAANRLISHLQAVQMQAVAEFARPGRCGPMTKLIESLVDHTGLADRPGGTVDPDAMGVLIAERARDMAAAEISAALHQSPTGASSRVSRAVELVQQMPATLAALKDGRIDLPRAAIIAERTALLDPHLRTAVETKVLPLAQSRTPGQLRPMIDLRVIHADPTASKKRTDQARRDRFVDHTPSVDGMGMIRAHLTAEGAVAVYDLLDRIARATAGQDDRTIGARRADALVDLCQDILATGYVDLRGTCTPDDGDNNTDSATANTTDSNSTNTDTDTDTDDNRTNSATANTDDNNTNTDGSVPAATTNTGTTKAETTSPETGFAEHPAAGKSAADQQAAEVDEAPEPAVATEVTAPNTPQPSTPRPGKRLSKVTKHHGRGAHFNLTMSLAAFNQFTQDPAELLGHGYLPAHIAQAMARSIRSLAVIVVDHHGHATAVGGTAYLPTQTTVDQVLTAAGTCRFPSCRIPAPLCDLDHREPFDHHHPERGGQTDPTSLDPLSRHHHFLKTFTDWTPTRSPHDGLTMLWTSPTGHEYVDHPKEHALPTAEQQDPTDPADGDGRSAATDVPTPAHHCCPCVTPQDEDGASTAHTRTEQIKLLNARREAEEAENTRLLKQQRIMLDHRSTFTYRLGMQAPPWPDEDEEDEDETQEEFNARMVQQIADCGSYEQFRTQNNNTLKRFDPITYNDQLEAERARLHPYPDEPPF